LIVSTTETIGFASTPKAFSLVVLLSHDSAHDDIDIDHNFFSSFGNTKYSIGSKLATDHHQIVV